MGLFWRTNSRWDNMNQCFVNWSTLKTYGITIQPMFKWLLWNSVPKAKRSQYLVWPHELQGRTTMKLSSPGPIIMKNGLPLWAYSLVPRENRAKCYKIRPIKSTQFCFPAPISSALSPPLSKSSLSPSPYICEAHQTQRTLETIMLVHTHTHQHLSTPIPKSVFKERNNPLGRAASPEPLSDPCDMAMSVSESFHVICIPRCTGFAQNPTECTSRT